VALVVPDIRTFIVVGATDKCVLPESSLSKPQTNNYKDWRDSISNLILEIVFLDRAFCPFPKTQHTNTKVMTASFLPFQIRFINH
jgi:hypothetical protein